MGGPVGRTVCVPAQIQYLVKQWTMSVASIPVGCILLQQLVVNCLCVSIVLITNYHPVVSNSDVCLQANIPTSFISIHKNTTMFSAYRMHLEKSMAGTAVINICSFSWGGG